MGVNSAGMYEFNDPFSTSHHDYIVINHSLQSTSEALTLVQDASTGKFSVTVDTTTTRTITFSLYGEI